jgi:hypothetical protein
VTSRENAPFGSAAWIDAELRARLGEGATIGDVAFEGRVATITGARFAIGEATIEVERAEIELGAGGPIGSLPIAARLVSLTGAIAVSSIALSVPIELRASEPAAPRWFSGAVHARGASFAGAAFEVEATLDVEAEGARLAGRVMVSDVEIADEITLSADPAIEIDLATRGPLEALALDGRAFARKIAIARRSMPDAAFRLDEVSVVLDVDRERLRYRDLSARSHGARVSGWGRVPFGTPAGHAEPVPIAAIAIAHAGAGPIASIASLAGLTVRASAAPIEGSDVFTIPLDLGVSGEVMVQRGGAVSAAAIAATPRSELRLRLAPSATSAPLALEGSTLRGRLAVEDAIVFGMFPGPVRPSRATMLDVDARLTRTIASPGLVGRVSSSRLVLVISDDPQMPRLAFDRVSTMIDVHHERLVWHGLSGRFSGGTFTSSGEVGLGPSSAIAATVGWTGVRIAEVPTSADGKSEISKHFDGLFAGNLRVSRRPWPGEELSARGDVTIVEPRYRFLDALAPDLARIGLPKLRSESNQALTAEIAFARGRLTARSIVATLSDVEAQGEASVGTDGTLRGALVANVLPSYLAESPLFAVHAALEGRVAVPIDVGGTVSAPQIKTRALSILESLLTENRVGDAVKSALDSLGEWGRDKRKDR